MIGRTVSHYEILRKIGEGGMGEVYAARDVRLGRSVALKRIRREVADERMRKRMWREARAAAAVNHPNVCQVFDVVDEDGELIIAMELLEGRSLAERLREGPLPAPEAIPVILQVLAALQAVHEQGLVHRDLKPDNVVLTAHGVKLLDFGLSRPPPTGATQTELEITQAGLAVGTPRYMSPEQWAGEQVGPGCDVFAAGAILFEMLTGRHAIAGSTLREIMEEVAHGRPPSVGRDPGLAPFDAVVGKALERRPERRYRSARAMADDLQRIECGTPAALPTRSVTYTRLMVLPFRCLRPDPEIDFLSFSLPDAIVASLSGLESVVVCSSVGASGSGNGDPDVPAIVKQGAVDAVLFGSLVRSGRRVRVTTQLVEAPGGTVLCARTAEATLEDIFELQDRLAREIVSTLAIELSPRDRQALESNRPASGQAYEFYLRANQLANNRRMLGDARELYRASLERDPTYAPAWARLGRAYRVLAKYSQEGDSAENFRLALEAFSEAFKLDPDLPLAHNLYTFLEVEELGRSRDAMARLLERARSQRHDPELFSGLVLTCRFCGLLDASLAANRQARRLDPGIQTSVHYTYFLRGQFQKALEHDDEDMKYVYVHALGTLGRESEAIRLLRLMENSQLPGLERFILGSFRASLEGNRDECVSFTRKLLDSSFHDPEGRYFLARNVGRIGEAGLALEILSECVERGFTPVAPLRDDPFLESARALTGFGDLLERAEESRRRAVEVYREAGGDAILGESSTGSR